MSNDFFEKIIRNAKGVKLTQDEKTRLFRAVDYYVERNPITKAAPKIPQTRSDFMWWSFLSSSSYSRGFALALLVFVVLGAGTSMAAGGALPGDILYPIKVSINEEIKAILLSDIGKARFEATRAGERLRETEALAIRGELDESKKALLEFRFEEHASNVQREIKSFREKGEFKNALEVTSHFEVALKSREASLVVANMNFINSGETSLDTIVDRVKDNIETAILVKKETEDTISDSDENSEDIKLVAKSKHDEAERVVRGISQKISTKSKTEDASVMSLGASAPSTPSAIAPGATMKTAENDESNLLLKAQALITKGDESLRAGRFNEAFRFYREAFEVAEEAEIIYELNDLENIDLEINDNILDEPLDSSEVLGDEATFSGEYVETEDFDAGNRDQIIDLGARSQLTN